MTRKVKLDVETQKRLCAMISVGCSVRRAATLCGCDESAVRKRERTDPEFKVRLRDAVQFRELAPLRQIREAGQKSWRAAAWLLERINPGEYLEKGVARPNRFDLSPIMESLQEADDNERCLAEQALDDLADADADVDADAEPDASEADHDAT